MTTHDRITELERSLRAETSAVGRLLVVGGCTLILLGATVLNGAIAGMFGIWGMTALGLAVAAMVVQQVAS
ncbi:hypothetical protein [Halocatena halophila]|uniref:hypothetical protein n=1 Tax=Halocatena halophila TaxID=2814576 RepID=UPI002ED4BAD9